MSEETGSATVTTREKPMKLDIKFDTQYSVEEWCHLLLKLQRFARSKPLETGREIPGTGGWRVTMGRSPGQPGIEASRQLSLIGFGSSSFGAIHLTIEVDPRTLDLGDVWIEAFGAVRTKVTPWRICEFTEISQYFTEFSCKGLQTSGWVVNSPSTTYAHNVLAIPEREVAMFPSWLQRWVTKSPPDFVGNPKLQGPQVNYLQTDAPAREVNGHIHFLDVTFTGRPIASISIGRNRSSRVEYPPQRCDVKFRRFVLQLN